MALRGDELSTRGFLDAQCKVEGNLHLPDIGSALCMKKPRAHSGRHRAPSSRWGAVTDGGGHWSCPRYRNIYAEPSGEEARGARANGHPAKASRDPRRRRGRKTRQARWVCECVCGNAKILISQNSARASIGVTASPRVMGLSSISRRPQVLRNPPATAALLVIGAVVKGVTLELALRSHRDGWQDPRD